MKPNYGPMVTDILVADGLSAVVDGRGFSDKNNDCLIEQNIDSDTMWLSNVDKLNEGIAFEFDKSTPVETIVVWNYNKSGYVDYGLSRADISIWTEKDGWKQVIKDAVFDKAEGTLDYDSPVVVNLEPVNAKKIRFDNLSGWHKDGYIGLSEVQFFSPLGPEACNPIPADASDVVSLSKMQAYWNAGKGSVIHNIYLGRSKDKLEHLGSIKGEPILTFDGLVPNTQYFWRVDEVAKDGTASVGPVWSFQTKGEMIAYWPFEEGQGKEVSDMVKSLSGELKGDSKWLPDGGKYGSAMSFDGDGDYVEIPAPALNINTRTMTIAGWFKAGKNESDRGLVFSRIHGSAAALNLVNNELHYHWNDAQETWGWSSGLELPVEQWAFAAVAVEPDKAIMYLFSDGKWSSSTNIFNHRVEVFDGPLYLAYDPHNTGRYYKGAIDDIRIYDYALSKEQVESLCQDQKLVQPTAGEVKLIDVAFVEDGESALDIAAQAAEDAKRSEQGVSADQKDKKSNLPVVVVIIAVVAIIAAVSSRKKK